VRTLRILLVSRDRNGNSVVVRATGTSSAGPSARSPVAKYPALVAEIVSSTNESSRGMTFSDAVFRANGSDSAEGSVGRPLA